MEAIEDGVFERCEGGEVEFAGVDEVLGEAAGVLEELQVADGVGAAERHGAGLTETEDIAGAADLGVFFGEFEAVGGLDECGESIGSFGGLGVGEEEAVALVGAAADASAELVELGDAEAFGLLDDHDGGIGHVDTDFDDGGGNEHLSLAFAEAVHDGVAVFAFHASVEEFDGESVEFVLAEFEEYGFGGSGIVFVLTFDAWADDVGLPAAADLLAEEVPDFAEFFRVIDAGGDDFLAAGREVADDGDFEVAELREAEAAGDGCGSHDQDVGAGAIGGVFAAGKASALADAEAVLFVDDGDAKFGEADAVLDECLGADDELDGAIGDAGGEFAATGGGETAEEQAAVDAAGGEELVDGFPVLGGEHFGGGHENGLSAGGDGSEHGVDGDGGFASADVGLQEPVHGLVQSQVVSDFVGGLVLSGGEAEVEEAADAGVDLSSDGDGGSGESASGLAAKCESDLEFEEVIEEDALAGGFPLFAGFREMQCAEGFGEFRELVLLAVEGREWICDGVLAVFECGAGEAAHGVHADAFGERVAWEHAGALFGIFVGGEHVYFGIVEFPAAFAAPRLAVEEQAVAVLEAAEHPRLVEPEPADEMAVAVEQDGGEAASVAERAAIAVGNNALHGLQEFRLELWDRAEVGEVVNVVGEMEEQVAGGLDVEVFEEQSALGADAADVLDRCEEPVFGGRGGCLG